MNIDPDSPAGSQGTDAATAAATTQDAKDDTAGTSTPVSSSEGATKEPELDLEAVVRKAMGTEQPGAEGTPPDGEEGEESDSAPDGDPPPQTEAEKAEAARVAQEAEDAKLPFHKHPRWQEQLRKEKELKEAVTTRDAQLAELAPKAERLDRIGAFMRDNDLAPEEVQRGFDIMAMMKRDPAKALEMLSPHLDGLQMVTGQKLPPDLQERVDASNLTEADAREIALSRVQAVMAQSTAQRATETVKTERQRQTEEQVAQAAGAMRTAVEQWEAGIKSRDPDYPKLQSFVTDRLRALLHANPPKGPKEAVELAEQALADVKANARKIMPPKAAVRTATSDKSSTQAAPAPSTMLDIVKQAISR